MDASIRTIERIVLAKFEYDEAHARLFFGNAERKYETTIRCATMHQLTEISDAVGQGIFAEIRKEDGKPIKYVKYKGCTFFCEMPDGNRLEVADGR